MIVTVRKSVLRDVPLISSRMRESDAKEVYASSKADPYNALLRSYILSDYAKTIMLDDVPIGMFGVVCGNAISSKGIPWMLGTEKIEKIPMRFLIGSMREIKDMLKSYRVLENYVHAENKVSINWLKWLGFTIHEPAPYGPLRQNFHRFDMEVF